MEQRSEEWFAARCGKVTASRIADLLARNQPRKGKTVGEWSARRHRYLAEKVAERITGKPRDRKRVRSLEDRLDLEPDARAYYEFYYDAQIELVGFVEHPRIPNAGCSPDGLIGLDGGIEIKCLDAEGHLEVITAEAFEYDSGYVDQCHFNMACTGRQWWDLVSFNPDMPEDAKIFRKRIQRDDGLIEFVDREVIEFLAEVDQKVEQVKAALRGSTGLTAALESSLASLHVN